jgi:hypothetical protein
MAGESAQISRQRASDELMKGALRAAQRRGLDIPVERDA